MGWFVPYNGNMSKTILVTGVNGFVGHHLTHEIIDRGHSVIGVGLQPKAAPKLAKLLDEYYSVDLVNPAHVAKLPLAKVRAVISLAGLANVGQSFDKPELYMQVNTSVIQTISQALLNNRQLQTRHLVVSTGAVYDPAQPMPLNEASGLVGDSSPYVKSKQAMEQACQEFIMQGLDLVIVRPFNHIGPGQEPGFLLPDLFVQIKQAASSDQPLKVGNLKTKRDYTDVRDVVRAYAELVTTPKLNHQVYNVCSGRSTGGDKILELLLASLALDKKPGVSVDQSRIRANDPPDIYGSFKRLKSETGWAPTIHIEQTIKDFIASST